MSISDVRDFLRHMEWADAVMWRTLLGAPSLSGDARARTLAHHFHSTQTAYLQLFRGLPVDLPEADSFADLRAVGLWARRFYLELPAYLQTLTDARLGELVTFPWAAQIEERLGSAGLTTVGDCLLQLALHSAHHRGQVLTCVREAGGEPPFVDYIAWVWMGRPAPEWGELGAE